MSTESKWKNLDIENKVRRILQDDRFSNSEHHLGRAYLTAYQIAIEFARLYSEDVNTLGFPVGGQGTGQHNSLAQYLAQQLSRNIQNQELKDIEGGFLSNLHLQDINFNYDGRTIHSSLTGTNYTLSMFRLKN